MIRVLCRAATLARFVKFLFFLSLFATIWRMKDERRRPDSSSNPYARCPNLNSIGRQHIEKLAAASKIAIPYTAAYFFSQKQYLTLTVQISPHYS